MLLEFKCVPIKKCLLWKINVILYKMFNVTNVNIKSTTHALIKISMFYPYDKQVLNDDNCYKSV